MIYTITTLTQIADCDVVLTWAGRERDTLSFKKTAEERLITKFAETSVEIESLLQGVIAELAFLANLIPGLPDGPTRDEYLIKQEARMHKKFVLETRRESYGSIALLQKQVEVAQIEEQIEQVDVFMTAVTTHRDTLVAAA